MFGSLAKDVLPEAMSVEAKDIVVVSIMPCTAKKHESDQDKFRTNGMQDVDYVLTTQELARMIDEAGLNFAKLQPESLDLPLGFKTGAGVIFGATGGVSEAVLRYVTEKVGGKKLDSFEFHAVRGQEGIREASVKLGDLEVRIAIVFGLANARKLAERIRKGDCPYHFIEVMSCPGGCVGGAGQPVTNDVMKASQARAKGLYDTDKTLQLHKPQDNYYVSECYSKNLGEVGGHKAHELLHTRYNKRRRIEEETISLVTGKSLERLVVGVCVGTSCHIRGSNVLLRKLIQHVQETGAQPYVDINASFCYERCDRGPTVSIGARVFERCTFEIARDMVDAEVAKLRTTQTI
jgi:NADH-quinone oxidoreductase subunit G